MRNFIFVSILLSLICFSSTIYATANTTNVIQTPSEGSFFPIIGQNLTLKWINPSDGTVTIYLKSSFSSIILAKNVDASDKQTTFTIPASNTLYVYNFEIDDNKDLNNFSQSDPFTIRQATTTTTSSTPTKTASPTTKTPDSTQFPTTSPSSTSSPTLTTGAIAGIAVGSAGGIVLILSTILFFILRRRRSLRKSKTLPPSQDKSISPVSQSPNSSHPGLDAVYKSELPANAALSRMIPRQELADTTITQLAPVVPGSQRFYSENNRLSVGAPLEVYELDNTSDGYLRRAV